jgi:uncharacterized FlaG/YvyC family protein
VTSKAYQAVKGANAAYDALADLLEAIERFLDHLHFYTKISSTEAIGEAIVKIMVELLSTIALVTRQIKHKQPSKSVLC